jgi:hypothetical protein
MSKFCSTVDTSLIWKPCKILKFILELETIQSAYTTVVTITTLYKRKSAVGKNFNSYAHSKATQFDDSYSVKLEFRTNGTYSLLGECRPCNRHEMLYTSS